MTLTHSRQNIFWMVSLIFVVFFSLIFAALFPQSSVQKSSLLSRIWDIEEKKFLTKNPEINLILTGDMMLGRYIGTLRERALGDEDPSNDLFPFTYMPQIFEAAKTALNTDDLDLVLGNLEGPIVEKQVAYGDMVFRFAPEVATLLKKVGFTTLQVANNHTFNQTREGLTETYNHLDAADLDAFGYPDTSYGEFSFIRYDFEGQSLGFLGLNDTDFKMDMDEVTARIKDLDSQVDTLIVGVHWGFEYEPIARDSVVNKAHQMVEAGADFIWGTHPHVVQNSEVYKGTTIYYSLGNFVFDQYWSTETQKGLVLALKISAPRVEGGKAKITVTEIKIDLVNKGEPTPSNEL